MRGEKIEAQKRYKADHDQVPVEFQHVEQSTGGGLK